MEDEWKVLEPTPQGARVATFSCELFAFARRMDIATVSRGWRRASGPATERHPRCRRELEQDIVVANVRVQHRRAAFLHLGANGFTLLNSRHSHTWIGLGRSTFLESTGNAAPPT
jgi:hypothetical protein